MEATQRYTGTLENLRRLGTRIAIDDFGTGYSSLKYLTIYPVNRLKLAQEFVSEVTANYRNAAVVRASIRLAHELDVEVIAEGVETEAQVRFLIGVGCEHAQGYYNSQPGRSKPRDCCAAAGLRLRAGGDRVSRLKPRNFGRKATRPQLPSERPRAMRLSRSSLRAAKGECSFTGRSCLGRAGLGCVR
jgi:predicted signal transduction protein with EAL and GGDEF domain